MIRLAVPTVPHGAVGSAFVKVDSLSCTHPLSEVLSLLFDVVSKENNLRRG